MNRDMAKVPATYVVELSRTESTSGQMATFNSSMSRRPSSIKPSMRSSRSRITLVGYDEDLDYRPDTPYGTAHKVQFTWLDHLLGVFCMKRGSNTTLARTDMPRKPEEDEDIRSSPYIVSVYVLSSQKDESRHFIPKEARCTIDTGNLQGNLVSRAFVTDVLRYPESQFQPLTKAEEAGGIGVTGHKLIPQGAISLTWYHSNSTRVFRDMRFLISEHPIYDVILGTRSIHQNRILDVPNLMVDHCEPNDEPNNVPGAEEVDRLRLRVNGLRAEVADLRKKNGKKNKDPGVQAKLHEKEKELATTIKQHEKAKRSFQQKRYWDRVKDKASKEELEELTKEWRKDFPPDQEVPELKEA